MITSKLGVASTLLALSIVPLGSLRAAEPHDHSQHQHHQHGAAVPAEQAAHAGDEHAQHQMAAQPADEHAAHRAAAVVAPPSPVIKLKLPDVRLTDQDGQTRRLLSEVMGDKIIVANFVYTSCTTICPVASTLFSQTQDKLGALLDSRVRLLSLSVDPARDTPARLKTYAASHGARPGWIWLTGAPSEVTAALKGFGTYTANYKDHPVVIMIGDGRSGKWTRYFGFQDPERLAAKVREVLAARDGVSMAAADKE